MVLRLVLGVLLVLTAACGPKVADGPKCEKPDCVKLKPPKTDCHAPEGSACL